MKKVLFIIGFLSISLLIGGCANSSTSQKLGSSDQEEIVDSTVYFSDDQKETFHSSISFSNDRDDTSFEVRIAPQSQPSFGGEMWEKGDEIIFTIFKSNQIAEVEVGICPVKEEDMYDYDEFTSEAVTIGPDEQKVIVTVPETGKYGILFVNKLEEPVSFKGKTNKKIENPLL